jgi:phosphate transport system ATP-binding protein
MNNVNTVENNIELGRKEKTTSSAKRHSHDKGNTDVRIAVKNLDFYYGKFQALKKVNLDMFNHEVTALIGPSGCGKSTFLRCLNRMNDLYPDIKAEGSIKLGGQDIYAKKVDVVHLRKRVGMVFQRPNPFPMSIWENIAYGPKLHGERHKKRLEEIIETSLRKAALWDEVKDVLNKSAFDLSGGQQQRLCIARVLAVEPEVVLMDEPCSALDPNSTLRIEELMEQLKSKYTIVIVTHNMQQAQRVAERTGFFLKGEMIEAGDTSQIFGSPGDKRTEDYVEGRFG